MAALWEAWPPEEVWSLIGCFGGCSGAVTVLVAWPIVLIGGERVPVWAKMLLVSTLVCLYTGVLTFAITAALYGG